jgi:predicted HNH restriction endonuclease
MGFRMANGAIYLETHHVIPLSEKGLDVVWNVVAVCPNDHRIAHYGVEREAWRHRMLRHLSLLYPDAKVDRLENLL